MSVVSISETDEDLAGRWSLVFEDFALLNAKPAATRLGFAAQLLLYRTTGRFGRGAGEFPDTVVTYLAEQIGASPAELEGYDRSEEHTSELQSLMRISYAVFCLKKKK